MISRIDIEDMTDAQDEARVTVKPLQWHKSHMRPWRDDYHTVPTAYTIRCADENGWRWSGYGGHGYCSSPEAARSAAQSDWERRIRDAVIVHPALARPSQAGDERVAEASSVIQQQGAEWTASAMILHIAETLKEHGAALLTARDDDFGRQVLDYAAALAAMDTPKGGGDE